MIICPYPPHEVSIRGGFGVHRGFTLKAREEAESVQLSTPIDIDVTVGTLRVKRAY